jgi:hypothetical protein
MTNNTLKAFAALALVGSTSVLTLAAAPAHAGWFSDLTGITTPKFIRSMDITDPNSGISNSALGQGIRTVGRGIDPTNPERNGGWWPKLDVTDPNQPISQFCAPLLQYGAAAAASAYGIPPQMGMAGGSTASNILCAGGSNYGAGRAANRPQYNPMGGGFPQPSFPPYGQGMPVANPGYSQIGGGFPQTSFPPYGQGMPVANPGYFPQMNGGYQPMRPAYSMPPSGFSSYSASPYQPRF